MLGNWGSGSLGGGCLLSGICSEGFFNDSRLLAEQILYIITAAHAGGSDLLVKQSVSHRGYTHGSCCAAVFTEEEGLGTTLRASLFGLWGQSERWKTRAFTN